MFTMLFYKYKRVYCCYYSTFVNHPQSAGCWISLWGGRKGPSSQIFFYVNHVPYNFFVILYLLFISSSSVTFCGSSHHPAWALQPEMRWGWHIYYFVTHSFKIYWSSVTWQGNSRTHKENKHKKLLQCSVMKESAREERRERGCGELCWGRLGALPKGGDTHLKWVLKEFSRKQDLTLNKGTAKLTL